MTISFDELRRSAGIDQLAEPDSHFDSITHQVPLRIIEEQMDVETRMLCGERGKTWDNRADSKARGRTHPQQSTKIPALANAVFRLIQGPEDAFDAGKKLGRPSPSVRPRECYVKAAECRGASRSAMIREAWDCDKPHSRAAAESCPASRPACTASARVCLSRHQST
jgi:hypothetical protein